MFIFGKIWQTLIHYMNIIIMHIITLAAGLKCYYVKSLFKNDVSFLKALIKTSTHSVLFLLEISSD